MTFVLKKKKKKIDLFVWTMNHDFKEMQNNLVRLWRWKYPYAIIEQVWFAYSIRIRSILVVNGWFKKGGRGFHSNFMFGTEFYDDSGSLKLTTMTKPASMYCSSIRICFEYHIGTCPFHLLKRKYGKMSSYGI